MAHAQKPDFVFRQKRRSPFKSAWASVQSIAGSRGVHISVSNAGYTTCSIRQFPLHFPSCASPCVFRFQTHSTRFPIWWIKQTSTLKSVLTTFEFISWFTFGNNGYFGRLLRPSLPNKWKMLSYVLCCDRAEVTTNLSRHRIPVEARFSSPVQTGSVGHPPFCTMATG
jgi:hypothetical protein